MSSRWDVAVIGGGLIGLAVGRSLTRAYPGVSLLVLEKEDQVALHQSSHNSGVVHSGLYYRPGSLKARLAVQGREELYQLCGEMGIPNRRSGKVVVAAHPSELSALEELQRRGRANGLTGLRRLGPGELREVEPEASGVAALAVPDAGVADFPAVASHLAVELTGYGAEVRTGHEVSGIDHDSDGVRMIARESELSARILVNCAGLHSDRVADLAGIRPSVRIVPFRGEYYRLSEGAAGLVRNLIYPVPDPRFPFLGVHFTRRIDGVVEVGPNAVLALGREHYRGTGPKWSDLAETLAYSGFLRLGLRYWWSGARELVRSRSRRLYAKQARRLVPAVSKEDLLPGGAGVRAQAVGRDGSLVDDFVIETAGSTVHVLNAPSPGATACLAIGRHIAEQVRPLLSGQAW